LEHAKLTLISQKQMKVGSIKNQPFFYSAVKLAFVAYFSIADASSFLVTVLLAC
jgi:hypothetical protein